MATEREWTALLSETTPAPAPVRAERYDRRWSTSSAPVLLKCGDGNLYVAKGPQNQKMIVADRVVGLLGRAMGAPVGEVRLVDVPEELIEAEPEMKHMRPGLSHGSRFLKGCTDREDDLIEVEVNRSRFAALAVLFGWVGSNDRQFIYRKTAPQFVYSVDHGHILPGGTDWNGETLAGPQTAEPDREMVSRAGLTQADLQAPGARLCRVGDATIASAIRSVPSEWGGSPEERVALADFLSRRREALCAHLGLRQEGADG